MVIHLGGLIMIKFGKWMGKHRGDRSAFRSAVDPITVSISKPGSTMTSEYLPNSLETVKGQDIMVDEFGTGAFSMVVVEDAKVKDVQKIKHKVEKVVHVKKVLWYDDLADTTFQRECCRKNPECFL